MKGDQTQAMPIDRRITIYRFTLRALALVAVILLVKFFVFDTYSIQTSQMSPTVLPGDRLLVFRFPYLAPFRAPLGIKPGKIVLAKPFRDNDSIVCLRVAGLSADTIAITDGVLSKNGTTSEQFMRQHPGEALPATFSPRDNMQPFVLPRKGTTYTFDSLSIRDLFFVLSLAQQENPQKDFQIEPILFVDGTQERGFSTTSFSLYNGPIDSVPLPQRHDWFFWEQMRVYLAETMPTKSIWLSFEVMADTKRLYQYKVQESCIFLLADNWEHGFDSRYFGPVSYLSIDGGAGIVLWSVRSDSAGSGIRANRFARILQ